MVTSHLSAEGKSGGASIYAYNLAKELSRQGHRVDLVATVDSDWPTHTPFQVYALKFSTAWLFGSLKWSVRAAAYAVDLIDRNNYDIIHVHHPVTYFYTLMSMSRVPMIATLHTGWALTNPRETTRRKTFDFLMDLLVCKRCARVIVMNRYQQKQLSRYFSRGKVQYIPNGIDFGQFAREKHGLKYFRELGIPTQATTVLYTGRLDKGKGVETLLDAWRIIQNQIDHRAWLIVVGDGSLKSQLMSKSRDLRNVVFTGSISRLELVAAYEEADLFVMPSEGGEGMPTVLLEAMAAGLPVVATTIPGITELGDTTFARLVPPGDAQKLASTMLDFTRDTVLLRQMGRKATSIARRLDWSTVASQIVELYKSCLTLEPQGDLLSGRKLPM